MLNLPDYQKSRTKGCEGCPYESKWCSNFLNICEFEGDCSKCKHFICLNKKCPKNKRYVKRKISTHGNTTKCDETISVRITILS